MALLFSNRYASLDLDQSVVRYVRSGELFASVEDLRQSHNDVARVLDRLGRARYALLVDLREARGANTGVIEQAMANERKRLLYGFNRLALLVRSAAGVLQVQRNLREDGISGRVFLDDERAALAYARGAGPVTITGDPPPVSDRTPSFAMGSQAAPSSGRDNAPISVRPPSSRAPTPIEPPPRSIRLEGPPSSSPASSGPTPSERGRSSERFNR